MDGLYIGYRLCSLWVGTEALYIYWRYVSVLKRFKLLLVFLFSNFYILGIGSAFQSHLERCNIYDSCIFTTMQTTVISRHNSKHSSQRTNEKLQSIMESIHSCVLLNYAKANDSMYETVTAMLIKSEVFCHAMPCWSVPSYWWFTGDHCLHLEGSLLGLPWMCRQQDCLKCH